MHETVRFTETVGNEKAVHRLSRLERRPCPWNFFSMSDDAAGHARLEEALVRTRAELEARSATTAERELLRPVTREINLLLARLALAKGAGGAVPPRRDLLSVICHDLKDPLASIVMGAGFLKRVLPGDDATAPARRVALAIQRSADRMNQLITDFYDLGKLEAGQVTLDRLPHDATLVARAAVDLALPQAKEKSIEIVVEGDTGAVLAVDRGRFLRILAKLLSNAIKFSDTGGRVTVAVKKADGRVVLSVRDEGRGVPAERRSTVFDRETNQRQSPRDGPGLGLAIAKALVALHGGDIGLEPADPRGTIVWFSLPV